MKIHIVKQGDTLYELSQKYGVPLDKLIEANPQLSNPDVLSVGDKVKIPTTATPPEGDLFHKHTVKQGDTLWKLSKAWGIQLKDMIEANPQLKNPDALKIGDVVNIPKKAVTPPAAVSPETMAPGAADKTVPGSKTYTGPIEKPETAPVIPVPVQEPVTMPAPAPVPEPAPPIVPIQETIHTETQNLFVQIQVPEQEVISYYQPMPEPPKTYCPPPEPPKEYCGCEPVMPCEKSYGYPGITENPNYYDCPPAYPLYESAPVTPYVPGYGQPSAVMPEMQVPYCYPEQGYAASEAAAPAYPGMVAGYSADQLPAAYQPYPEHPIAMPPQYMMQPPLPWPTCGCGGYSGVQPYAYGGYETPVYGMHGITGISGMQGVQGVPGMHGTPAYGASPVYTGEAAYPPGGMSYTQPYTMPQVPGTDYMSTMAATIPPVPQYPANQDWAAFDRNPADSQLTADTINERAAVNTSNSSIEAETKNAEQGQNGKAKAKVKTSALQSRENKAGGPSKQKSANRKEGTKKRKNPWISN